MSEFNKISGYLYYTCIQNPVPCMEESKGKEFKVSIVTSRDFADDYADFYTKTSVKKVRTADFEAQYKTAPPEEFADEKFQYVITVRKNTNLGNGNPVPAMYCPKVLIRKKGKLVDVTEDTLVGNGSKGIASLEVYETDTGKYPGKYPRLKNILVEELVEYVKPESNNRANFDDVFGEYESNAVPTEGEFEEKKEEPKPTAKPASRKPTAKPKLADEDEESPF